MPAANHRNDRRVRMTRRLIKDSFLTLLRQKNIAKITVKDICLGADINRATFYAHYESVYDLLHKMEDELAENICTILKLDNTPSLDMTVANCQALLEHIKAHEEFCMVVINLSGDTYFQDRIMALIGEPTVQLLEQTLHLPQEDARLYLVYQFAGYFAIIREWVATGMTRSITDMARLMTELSPFSRQTPKESAAIL